MQFAEIEMLDIPSEGSDAGPDAGSDTGSAMTDGGADKCYPSLQEWLTHDKDLEFQFSASNYQSLESAPEQREYINRLYKIVEQSQENCAAHDLGPIGVISSVRALDKKRAPAHVVQAFAAVLEAFNSYYAAVVDTLADSDARDLTALSSILECLHAQAFFPAETSRPELILNWINSYDPKPENEFIDAVMYSTPTPWKHPQFWTSYLGTLLSRGMFERAAASIAASKYHELPTPLVQIIEDLETLVGAYAGMALKGQFPQWKQQVCEFRDGFGGLKAGIEEMEHVTIASQIHDLLCLMSGMQKTTAQFVSTWYEMYGCLALFQVRDDASVFPDYFRVAVAEKGYNVAEPVEETFRDILSGNYLRVILAIDQCDSPTAAYVSKLFDGCGFFQQFYRDIGQIDDDIRQIGNDNDISPRRVSDYLLVRHAFSCLETHELVPVGLGLLVQPVAHYSQCREVVAEFLPQYRYETNDDLEWALTICAKLKMPETAQKLFMKQALRSLKDGHVFEALNMLVRCCDDGALSADGKSCQQNEAMAKIQDIVWNDLFSDALLNSSPVPDELIDNVVSKRVGPDFPVHPIIRQCLAPYAVLCEYFSTVCDEQGFSKSLSSMFHLIRFKYMPDRFVPLLLAQFLPFFGVRKFELPQLIIMIELIDTFEMHEHQGDDEKLYKYAIENIPTDVQWDWRSEVTKQGGELPKTVKNLVKELRNRIVRSIGEVYIA